MKIIATSFTHTIKIITDTLKFCTYIVCILFNAFCKQMLQIYFLDLKTFSVCMFIYTEKIIIYIVPFVTQ